MKPFRISEAAVFIYKVNMINIESLIRDLELVRGKSPLIHNITNYVVMNNTANALLSIGASPVMAHAIDEVSDMVRISSALVLNIGTIDAVWEEAMLNAGNTARENNIPVVFDPVGVGATPYRASVCRQIIKVCKPSIIRGNASEIIALTDITAKTKGVDSTDSSDIALESAKKLALKTGAVVVISGQTDYITDGHKTGTVLNGNHLMARVTGMGCTATAIVAAFAAVNSDMFTAAIHGMSVMGITGEIAARKSEGNGSMQVHFLDELYNLDGGAIKNNIRL